MATTARANGEFCWINMLTSDPAKAREFYGTLLGWTYAPMGDMGHRIQVAGNDVGGLFDLAHPSTPQGTAPMIGVMVKVDNVDAMSAKVTSLGGKVRPAFDVMESGRMAVCNDPNGAQFDLWQPKKMHGFDVDPSLHGAPSWFETLTTDTDGAIRFYSSLFGWTPNSMPLQDGSTYTDFKLGERFVGGLMEITPEMADGHVTPQWGVYFTVDDVDETEKLALELGATICVPSRDIEGVGRICGIVSPQDVVLYAITYAS
jgi:predicted enzyme related to lactoylglutathione lyase